MIVELIFTALFILLGVHEIIHYYYEKLKKEIQELQLKKEDDKKP